MAEGRVGKTTRASLGDKGISGIRACPQCGTIMVATKVIKSAAIPGGMYWVCPKGDFRAKIQRQ